MATIAKIPLRKIKILTKKMSDVSWRELWGNRRNLKRLIKKVAEGNKMLKREYLNNKKLRITQLELATKSEKRNIEKTGKNRFKYDKYEIKMITGFIYSGETFPLGKKIILKEESKGTHSGPLE